MWRSSFLLLKEGLTSGIVRSKTTPFGLRTVFSVESSNGLCKCLFSGTSGAGVGDGVRPGINDGVRAMFFTTAGGVAGLCVGGVNEGDRRSFSTNSGGYGGGDSDRRSFSTNSGGYCGGDSDKRSFSTNSGGYCGGDSDNRSFSTNSGGYCGGDSDKRSFSTNFGGYCGGDSDKRSFSTNSGGYGGGDGDKRSFSSTVGGDSAGGGHGVRRGVDSDGGAGVDNDEDIISVAEAKKLMRLVNVDALKMKFSAEGKEVIYYKELLDACETTGVAKSVDEAKKFATVLDEAGVVLIFRDKVYLHPDKVVDLVRRAVPLALTADDDPRREELKKLQAKQDEIDKLAHKQVRRILYSGLAFSLANIGLFFRLTFWEFSWDVMEPIAFFATTSGLIVGYAYFLITSRDPTYQDLMKRLFLSRRRKLMKKHNFNIERFMELQKKCKSPLDAPLSAKHDFAGVVLETQDLLHKN